MQKEDGAEKFGLNIGNDKVQFGYLRESTGFLGKEGDNHFGEE